MTIQVSSLIFCNAVQYYIVLKSLLVFPCRHASNLSSESGSERKCRWYVLLLLFPLCSPFLALLALLTLLFTIAAREQEEIDVMKLHASKPPKEKLIDDGSGKIGKQTIQMSVF